MRLSAISYFVGVLLVLLSTLTLPCCGSDADILLDWMNSLSSNFVQDTWNAGNKDNLCVNWQGVRCTPGNRVSELELSIADGVSGDGLPSSFGNLTELRLISFTDMHNFTGYVAQEIFQLPHLAVLAVESTMSVIWPASVAAPIEHLSLNELNVSGSVPDIFPWATMATVRFESMAVTCPLPQGLVDRMRVSPILTCAFAESFLWVDNNDMLCGQIHVSDIPCRTFPLFGPPPIFTANGTTASGAPPLQFTAEYKNLLLEFRADASVSFFIKYRKPDGSQAIFREQYAKFNYYPITVVGPNESLVISDYTHMSWVTQRKLVLNATMFTLRSKQLMQISWIYEFDSNTTFIEFGGVPIKFSIAIQNINFTWPVNLNPRMAFIASYRLPYAPEEGPPMLCQARTRCSSSIATWNTDVDIDSGQTTISVTTNLTEFVFAFSFEGNTDGISFRSANSLRIKAAYYFSGAGYDAQIRMLASRNRIQDIPRPGRDQYMIITANLQFPKFQSFLYDPDLNLRVLFDTPPDQANPDNLNELSSNTVTVAAAVSVTVVVVVGAAVGGFVVYRRRKADKAETAAMISRIDNAKTTEKETQKSSPPAGTSSAPPASGGKTKAAGWTKAIPKESAPS